MPEPPIVPEVPVVPEQPIADAPAAPSHASAAAPDPLAVGLDPLPSAKRLGLARVILNDVGELEHFAEDRSKGRGRRVARRLLVAVLAIVLVAAVAVGGLAATGRIDLSRFTGPLGAAGPTATPAPSTEPSAVPSPSAEPSAVPSSRVEPTAIPSAEPTAIPSAEPTAIPSATTPATPFPSTGPFFYTVQVGETLTDLSLRFGVSIDAIVKANNLPDKNLIITGQRLLIPAP